MENSAETKEKEIKKLYSKLFDRVERNKNDVMEKGEFFNYLKVILKFNFEENIGKDIPEHLEEAELSAAYSNYIFKAIDIDSRNQGE